MSVELDRDLDAARRELMDAAHVLTLWRHRGGGVVSGTTARLAWPGAPSVDATDADLAAVRALELQGSLSVTWPFNVTLGRPSAATSAPLDSRIEAAARALATAQPRGEAP